MKYQLYCLSIFRLVESGEGIERQSPKPWPSQSSGTVESGEGIER